MTKNIYQAEVVVVGGGIAGIVAAYELLGHGKKVLLIEKGKKENFGGLAKESFGGIHLINSPYQRRMGIHDTPDLAYRDWERVAHFEPSDYFKWRAYLWRWSFA